MSTDADSKGRKVGAKKAAEDLGVSERTVRYWAEKGLLPYTKEGRRRRYHVDDLKRVTEDLGLPITRYNRHNTFIVWIQFAPDTCREWGNVERWCSAMQKLVKDYIRSHIERDVQENAARHQRPKLLLEEVIPPTPRQAVPGAGRTRNFQVT